MCLCAGSVREPCRSIACPLLATAVLPFRVPFGFPPFRVPFNSPFKSPLRVLSV